MDADERRTVVPWRRATVRHRTTVPHHRGDVPLSSCVVDSTELRQRGRPMSRACRAPAGTI